MNLALLREMLVQGSSPHSLRLCPDVATILANTPIEKLVRLCRINLALFVPSTEVLRDAIEQMSEAPLVREKEQLLCEAEEEEKTPKARRAQGGR